MMTKDMFWQYSPKEKTRWWCLNANQCKQHVRNVETNFCSRECEIDFELKWELQKSVARELNKSQERLK